MRRRPYPVWRLKPRSGFPDGRRCAGDVTFGRAARSHRPLPGRPRQHRVQLAAASSMMSGGPAPSVWSSPLPALPGHGGTASDYRYVTSHLLWPHPPRRVMSHSPQVRSLRCWHAQTDGERDEATCGYRLGAGSLAGDVCQWGPGRLRLPQVPARPAGAGGSFTSRRRSDHERGHAGGGLASS